MAAMKFGLYNLSGIIFGLLVQKVYDDIWAVSKNLCDDLTKTVCHDIWAIDNIPDLCNLTYFYRQ